MSKDKGTKNHKKLPAAKSKTKVLSDYQSSKNPTTALLDIKGMDQRK